VSRDYELPFTSWLTVSKYNYVKNHPFFNTNYIFHVNVSNVLDNKDDPIDHEWMRNDKSLVMTWDIETCDLLSNDIPQPERAACRIFTICASVSYKTSDLFPKETDPQSENYNPVLPDGYLCHYAFTTEYCNPIKNRKIVVCDSEKELLQAFIIWFGKIKPDIWADFNGSNYDMPWLMYRANKYGLIPLMESQMSCTNIKAFNEMQNIPRRYISDIERYYYYKSYQTKLTNDISVTGHTISYPGYVCIDLMPQLRIYLKNPDYYSLKFFLNEFKLGNKIDMPYLIMFEIYKLCMKIREFVSYLPKMSPKFLSAVLKYMGFDHYDYLLKRMSHVTEYCFVDGIRCQDLLLKTHMIDDKRAVGKLSYVSLHDCFYRADGMKVRNITAARAFRRGVHISLKNPDKIVQGKYPGAFVFPPKKGIKRQRATVREMIDNSKQIAIDRSIHIDKFHESCLSISDERITEFESQIVKYGIYKKDWPVEARPAELCLDIWLSLPHFYPIGGLDFSSLYPSLMMAYNLSPDKIVHDRCKMLDLYKKGKKFHKILFEFNGQQIRGWSVRHNYDTDSKLDPDSDEADFGLFPTILLGMFRDRKKMKKKMKVFKDEMEIMELLKHEEFILPKNVAQYAILSVKYNYLNVKQKAFKQMMNTFYGESGNSRSALRVLACAGGITTAGRVAIKEAAKFVESLGCEIFYGDTDSIYIMMAIHHFAEIDKQYYGNMGMSKIDYLRECVKISFIEIEKVQNLTNDHLYNFCQTHYLKMAYEELLYPLGLFSKKKYAGIAHEEHFNEHPKDIFVRGLEYVKKGKSKLLVDISKDILWTSFDYDNLVSLIDIVNSKIEEIFVNSARLRQTDFIKSASYKPTKQNISVQNFVKRMCKERGIEQEPYKRFRYIVIEKYPFKFDVRGRKSELSVGERMEYVDVAKNENMKPDLIYYMGGAICGQLARYISYHQDFKVEPTNPDDLESVKKAEEDIMKACKKYIIGRYKSWRPNHVSKGRHLQAIFKRVDKAFVNAFKYVLEYLKLPPTIGKILFINWTSDDKKNIEQIIQLLQTNIYTKADKARVKRIHPKADKFFTKNIIPMISNLYIDEYTGLITVKSVYEDRIKKYIRRPTFKQDSIKSTIRSNLEWIQTMLIRRNNIVQTKISIIEQTLLDESNSSTITELNYKTMLNGATDATFNSGLIQEITNVYTASDFISLMKFSDLWNELEQYADKHMLNERILYNIKLKLVKYTGFHSSRNDITSHTSDIDDYLDSLPDF